MIQSEQTTNAYKCCNYLHDQRRRIVVHRCFHCADCVRAAFKAKADGPPLAVVWTPVPVGIGLSLLRRVAPQPPRPPSPSLNLQTRKSARLATNGCCPPIRFSRPPSSLPTRYKSCWSTRISRTHRETGFRLRMFPSIHHQPEPRVEVSIVCNLMSRQVQYTRMKWL